MSILFILLALVGALIGLFTLIPVFSGGAVFQPTRRDIVERMIRLARVRPGEKAADLGSGDGRIVIALARAGAEAHGYEVNPLLVLWARYNIRQAGLAGKAFIHRKSFWFVGVSAYTVVTTFQVGSVMHHLEKKLHEELPPGARVVSHFWKFPAWRASATDQELHLYTQEEPTRA